jgi:hypothetical protein
MSMTDKVNEMDVISKIKEINQTNQINEIDEIISCLCTNVPQNPPLGGGPGVQRTPGKRRGQNPGSRFEKKAFSCSELAV